MSSAALSSGQSSEAGQSSRRVRVEFLVQGMTCAACAAKVESRLNAVENVSATVNYATEKAIVTKPIAGAAMAASSAFVVGNSVRLRRFGASAPARRGRRPRPSGPAPMSIPGTEPEQRSR